MRAMGTAVAMPAMRGVLFWDFWTGSELVLFVVGADWDAVSVEMRMIVVAMPWELVVAAWVVIVVGLGGGVTGVGEDEGDGEEVDGEELVVVVLGLGEGGTSGLLVNGGTDDVCGRFVTIVNELPSSISTSLLGSSQQGVARLPSQHQWPSSHWRMASLPGAVPSTSSQHALAGASFSPREGNRLTLRAILRTRIILPKPIRARVSSPELLVVQVTKTVTEALPVLGAACAGVAGGKAWVGVWGDIAVGKVAVLGGREGGDGEERSGGEQLHRCC